MFRGANKLSLDAKGRLAIPKRYRERIADVCDGQLIVTASHKGPECLRIYPLPTWEVIEAKLEALPSFDDDALELQRLMIGYADDPRMDKAGRILVSPELREFAGLDHRVVLIGQGSKFELWDEARWNERRSEWSARSGPKGEPSDVLKTLSL